MDNSRRDQSRQSTVALVRWSKKPGDNPLVRFVMSSVFALILCLILMIFIHGLRSFGAVVLFTVVAAAVLTSPSVSRRRAFMTGLTKRVNDTIAEVTGNPGDRLSVKEFRRMVRSGEPLPLLVRAGAGLNLHVERVGVSVETDVPEKWFNPGTADKERQRLAAPDHPPEFLDRQPVRGCLSPRGSYS